MTFHKAWRCRLCGFVSKEWTDLSIHAEGKDDEEHNELYGRLEDKTSDATMDAELEWIEEEFDERR